MRVDKEFCMSAYLMFRSILNKEYSFSNAINSKIANGDFNRNLIHNSMELQEHLKKEVYNATLDGKAALMLSGGIDSAILAKWMPKGSKVYTLKCVVPGKSVIDETSIAQEHANRNGLIQEIVPVYWEDFEKYAPILMKEKGAPIHSIEVQIYKAALKAKQDGFTKLIFGENADIIYGGMDGLLSKDWLLGEFIDRYSYILPYKVLKNYKLILEPFYKYEKDGYVDAYNFINEYFRIEALGTYTNACETAGIEFVGPYSTSKLDIPIDYNRIRSGDTKYLVREIFKNLYPNVKMSPKIPMPRPMDEWMKRWVGPIRNEFIPNCTLNMTGDQKWMVYSLENYLNILDE